MIVVDTSVWIDVLNGVDSEPAMTCVRLIENGEPVALTDIIFTEVLQGLRGEPRRPTSKLTSGPSRSCDCRRSTTSRSPLSCTGRLAVRASRFEGRSTA